MAPRRIFSNVASNNRVVTIGGPSSLNERFSQLHKTTKVAEPASKSVFQRLQMGKGKQLPQAQRRNVGRTNAGVQKRTAHGTPSHVQKAVAKHQQRQRPQRQNGGVQGKQNGRPAQHTKVVAKQKGRGNQRTPIKNAKHKAPKKLTAEDLDKSLDDYMMKDEKYAQSKLDAELTSYMDKAEDILMEL